MTQNTDRYRTYVTQTGFDLEALANQQGTKVDFAMLVVGDGELPDSSNPANQTSLINQVRHYPVTIEVDDKDPTIWVARAEIPAEDGGFTIRETGVKVTNESGDLYCYARQPGDYKPVLEEGSAKSYTIRLKFIPGNASVIEAKIDPSVQFATPTDLSNAIKEHEEKQDPHSQYLTKDKKSSVESAKTGSKDDEWMTPLTTHQAFNQFGLGKGVVFSGDDFHLMTQAGQFRFHTNTSTKNVPFGLEGHWFDVIVTGTINNRSALIAVDYGNANEPRIFHKSNANNVWSDWVELSHSGNLKLPIYPEINSVGHVAGLTLSGTNLTVANSEVCFYGWQKHRINPAGNSFTIDLSKTYHLRFSIQSGLKLKDVTDATYNPSSKAETDTSFDSTYDDMLLAKIEAGTLVPLINKPVLYAGNQMKGENNNPTHPARIFTYNWARTPTQSEGLVIGINAHSLTALDDWNFTGREGVAGFDVMLVTLDRYKVYHKYRALDDNPSWEGGIIGTRFKQEVRA